MGKTIRNTFIWAVIYFIVTIFINYLWGAEFSMETTIQWTIISTLGFFSGCLQSRKDW